MSNDRPSKLRSRNSGVGTIIGITLVLFMLGVLGWLALNGRAIEQYLRETMVMEVMMERDVKEVDVMQFRKLLDTQPFTASTGFITADEAAELMKKELGEDFLGVTGTNPLTASIQLHLKPAYAQPDSMKWIAEHLRQDHRTGDVSYNATVLENVDANLKKLTLIGGLFCLLLLIIAVALINNTIRLSIYSKRFLIRTMHLVGATQWFIKRPFLGRSLWQGLVASVLAIGLLVGMLALARNYVPDLLAFTDVRALGILFAGVLVLGLLISLLSTWFAVRRYLRMNTDELNFS
ncbi:MAG: ABC transporter permease [Flavobacteriales bacterium]|nr:ABC transporter permease [Flavobacteriales bacterium]